MVSSSQKESSRNAVEERPGRGNGRSSLRDERSIEQKISQEALSCEKLENLSGRVKSKHRNSLTGNSSMRKLFGVQLKPSVLGARSTCKALLLVMLFGGTYATAYNFMEQQDAKAFMEMLPGLVRKAHWENPTAGVTTEFKMKDIFDSGMTDKGRMTCETLDGYYYNRGALSRFETKSSRMKWNYLLPIRRQGLYESGFSPLYSKQDLKVYTRSTGARECVLFTAVQSKHLYFVVPFKTTRNKTEMVDLHVFSTKSLLEPSRNGRNKCEWIYKRMLETPTQHKLYEPINRDMEKAWKMNFNAIPPPRPQRQEYDCSGRAPPPCDIDGVWQDNYPDYQNNRFEEQSQDRWGQGDYDASHHSGSYGRNSSYQTAPSPSPSPTEAASDPTQDEDRKEIGKAVRNLIRREFQETWKNNVKGWVHVGCKKGLFAFNQKMNFVWHPFAETLKSVLERNKEAVRASLSEVGSACSECGSNMPRNAIQTKIPLQRGEFGYKTK